MRKLIALAACLSISSYELMAQMTLEHNYSTSSKVVMINLMNSGRKYAVQEGGFGNGNLVVKLYDLNHSLWKTITPPTISGFNPFEAFYISENLFKIDNKINMAVVYGTNGGALNFGKCVVIDEVGNIVTQVDNAGYITVYNAGNNQFKAIVDGQMSGGDYVYALPGTIPNSLGNGLGLASISPISDPMPNPSSDQVKIEYHLPEGKQEGTIEVFATDGKKLKSYRVDKNFTYITIDNSELPAGTYYYNFSIEGDVYEIKKMLVVK